jgi:sigma-E factor negative regulatory protein RseA
MKSDLSAWMDGVLEDDGPSYERLRRDGELHRVWAEYHLIGDALRGEPRLAMNVAPRVMAALAAEPTVLVPAAGRRSRSALRFALPLAASVMGIGAVAWVAQSLRPAEQPATLAASAPRPAATEAAAVPVESEADRSAQVQPYLFAHQGHSFMGNVQGVAPYVRIVSDARGPGR